MHDVFIVQLILLNADLKSASYNIYYFLNSVQSYLLSRS